MCECENVGAYDDSGGVRETRVRRDECGALGAGAAGRVMRRSARVSGGASPAPARPPAPAPRAWCARTAPRCSRGSSAARPLSPRTSTARASCAPSTGLCAGSSCTRIRRSRPTSACRMLRRPSVVLGENLYYYTGPGSREILFLTCFFMERSPVRRAAKILPSFYSVWLKWKYFKSLSTIRLNSSVKMLAFFVLGTLRVHTFCGINSKKALNS